MTLSIASSVLPRSQSFLHIDHPCSKYPKTLYQRGSLDPVHAGFGLVDARIEKYHVRLARSLVTGPFALCLDFSFMLIRLVTGMYVLGPQEEVAR